MTVYSQGIPLKKQFGQHFLRDQDVVECALARVSLDATSSVFEIGGGMDSLRVQFWQRNQHACGFLKLMYNGYSFCVAPLLINILKLKKKIF